MAGSSSRTSSRLGFNLTLFNMSITYAFLPILDQPSSAQSHVLVLLEHLKTFSCTLIKRTDHLNNGKKAQLTQGYVRQRRDLANRK